jgi:hypothetical protein
MEAFLHPGLQETWVACGTKFGKSLGASGGICNALVRKQRGLFRWVAPIYEQSKVGFEYCKRILPPEPHTKPNNSEMAIKIPDLDTLLRFFHAGKPTSLEGHGVHGYVFDEAAKMLEEVRSAAETTTTLTRGPKMFISTPLGKNWFYRGCMEAREEMIRARHEKRAPTKLFIRAKTEDNPFVPRESIEKARRELPARLFRQYYLAEFEDEGAIFPGYRACTDGPRLNLEGEHHIWFHDEAKNAEVVVGVDWAKSVDWTVFIAIDVKTRRVVGFERFHKRTYTEAIRQLVRFTRTFKELTIVYHDKTGVGAAIDDQLACTDLPFHGITFTNAWKSEAVSRLMTTVEQEGIILPDWPILMKEMDSFELKMTVHGKMQFSAPGGQTDDAVMALLLAHSALLHYGEQDVEVRFLEPFVDKDGKPLPEVLTPLERFYKDLAEDEDD